MKRRLFAATAALGAVGLLAPAAHAGDQWCEDDPLVVIKTPGGSLVALYVTNAALGVEHLPAVLLAKIDYTVSRAGPSTNVHMTVTIPSDMFDSHFPTRSTVSTGPLATGTIYATAEGESGKAMRMQFILPVP
jgi:hypothetical protein